MPKDLNLSFSKLTAAVLIGGYFFSCIQDPGSWHFIDSVDLIIHEAGHTIIFFLGEFVQILAGSLFQILVPALFIGYFYNRSDYFSTSLIFTWLGYNLINVSVYISDAISMQLPLLGGDNVIHDWNYLLSETNLLSHTHQIGYAVHSAGMIVVGVSIIMAFWFAFRGNK